MTPLELLAITALCVYAIYKQTQRHEIIGATRFKLALLYGIIGIVVGGFHLPNSAWAWTFLVIGILLSLTIGLLRARHTKFWKENSRVYAQGTVFTITLFIFLIVSKFALGAIEYFNGIRDTGGFGEALILIAIMIGVQAELLWRRALPLGARMREKA